MTISDADDGRRIAEEAPPRAGEVGKLVDRGTRGLRAHRPSPARDPEPRIDQRDREIDQQVGDDEEQARHQHHRHHGIEVLAEDRAQAVARDAGPGEHHLDDEGIADQRRKLEAEDGERRDAGQPQHVLERDHAAGHAERAQRLDMIAPRDVEHARARDAHDLADAGRRQGEPRQEECATTHRRRRRAGPSAANRPAPAR